jgi:hypothetical protein
MARFQASVTKTLRNAFFRVFTQRVVVRNYKYQYNETNVMHFSFSLLRIKDPYMFQALLTHPQEVFTVTLGILCACYVNWLHQGWSGTAKCCLCSTS